MDSQHLKGKGVSPQVGEGQHHHRLNQWDLNLPWWVPFFWRTWKRRILGNPGPDNTEERDFRGGSDGSLKMHTCLLTDRLPLSGTLKGSWMSPETILVGSYQRLWGDQHNALEEWVATLTDCAKCTSIVGDAPPLLPECINGVNIKDFWVRFNATAPAFTRDSPSRALSAYPAPVCGRAEAGLWFSPSSEHRRLFISWMWAYCVTASFVEERSWISWVIYFGAQMKAFCFFNISKMTCVINTYYSLLEVGNWALGMHRYK